MNATVDTAVILAAGNGRRLHSGDLPPSKPLTAVGGIPLLTRTLRVLQEKGIRRAVVVTGFRAEEIEGRVAGDPQLSDLHISFARNEEWEKSNGISVLASRPFVDGEFLLLMADHVFEPSLLDGILSEEACPDAGGAVLAIDTKIDDVYDLEDATLVLTDGRGEISDIGKEIERFDAVDTGVFRATSGLFDTLQAAREEHGDCSLSDGIRALASAGKMRTFDVGDAWWQDVDTPGALEHAENLLFEACRKPLDGIVSRRINRNISLAISRRLKDVPISPNVVSLFNGFIGIMAALAVTNPTYGWFLVGALLLQLNSILDGVDGELARVRLQQSKLGEWLDTLVDDGTTLIFYIGLGVGASQLPGGAHYGVGATIFAVAYVTLRAIYYREMIAKGTGDLYAIDWDFETEPNASLASRVLFGLRTIFKQDFRILGFVVFALAGVLPFTVWIMAVGSVANIPAAVARQVRVVLQARARIEA